MSMILIEPYKNYTIAEASKHGEDPDARRVELEAFATILRDIFLGPH